MKMRKKTRKLSFVPSEQLFWRNSRPNRQPRQPMVQMVPQHPQLMAPRLQSSQLPRLRLRLRLPPPPQMSVTLLQSPLLPGHQPLRLPRILQWTCLGKWTNCPRSLWPMGLIRHWPMPRLKPRRTRTIGLTRKDILRPVLEKCWLGGTRWSHWLAKECSALFCGARIRNLTRLLRSRLFGKILPTQCITPERKKSNCSRRSLSKTRNTDVVVSGCFPISSTRTTSAWCSRLCT
mmetsp:Transcript_34327/g.78313  ORF Transcript_34327/g.78313 Transcript_34327/m.78313 type:complete len:233 (-) Transcript_34327:1057-1755(-)